MKNNFLHSSNAKATRNTGGGSSQNQTNDTQSRENRLGVISESSRTQVGLNTLHQLWRYAACLLLAFVLGIGNVWGADSTSPATKSYANRTFLDIAGTDANARIKNADSTLAFNAKYLQATAPAWVDKCSDGGSSSTSSTSGLADAGFLAHGSNNTGDSDNSYEYSCLTKIRSDRPFAIYVTGITSVGMVAKGAANNSNKWIGINVEEVASNGDLTTVAQAANNKNYSSTAAMTIVSSFETGKSISADKYYKITILGGTTTAVYLWQVRFGKPLTAPTALANTAVTSTTATMSIEDGKNINSYEFYYSTNNTAPSWSDDAIVSNITSKTPELTGLTAATTYYCWVRSKLSATNKSFWKALTGNTFTTESSGGGDPEPEDTTPPTLSSSTPANSATDVAVSGNIVLTFSEDVTVNDASKFSISPNSGVTLSTPTVSGAVVTIPYSGLANSTTYTFSTAASAVKDASDNMNEALDDISFTTEVSVYAVTHTLTNNITAKSGDTGASAATEGTAYEATFGVDKLGLGTTLPSTITVTIGGETATAGTDYTWDSSTGAFQVPAAKVTGAIVVTIAGVAPVKTFKSDYSDFTQVGETRAYYTYLAQTAYTSYAVAGWTAYENENFTSKKLKIDPATDEEISGSNANYGVIRSDRIMEYYLTGISSVKFYIINGGSSGDPRVAKYTLNGGDEATLVSVEASTSNTGTIELDPSTNNTIRLYGTSDLHVGAMKVMLPPSCSAPTSVSIAPTEIEGNYGWRYSKGETIDFTCTYTGGTGTPSYQWQKYVTDAWVDINTETNASAGTARLQIANCTSGDGGSYRCVVSMGTNCDLASDGYFLRVFTLNGNYNDDTWSENAIVWTDEFTGTATLNLNASSLYKFKVTDNNGKWFGNGDNNIILSAINWDCGINNSECRLFTGPAGNYVATIDITHAAENSPYVNVQLAYPSVTHPAEGYSYFEKPTDWTEIYLYWYTNDGNRLTDWDHTPAIATSTTICEKTYYYSPLWDKYDYVIYKGNGSNQWPNATQLSTTGCSGKYLDKTDYDAPAWASFATNTISFAGNGNTSGEMSDISGLVCGANQALPENAFEKTGYNFTGWKANVDVTIAGETVDAGTVIADEATLQNINSDITLTAQWEAIPTYTISLDANGGSVASYDGWTLSAGKYTKTVAEGTELALLEFTRSGYEFMTWRAGAVDKTSPITVSADIELKAIWGTEEEVTIYSWESPSGTAIEEGGTATHYNADGPVAGNTRVNYSNTVSSTTYYTISLNGKSDWSTDYIKISLDEVIKTGDKVKLTAYYNNSNNKTIDAKMKTAAGTEVFAGSGCAKNSPTEYEYTVPTIVDADELLMTRTTTETNCFITKLVITGNRVVEVLDPAEQPTITTQPTGGTYAWNADATQTVVATVSDGGTLSYQWYKKGDTDTKVGTNSASYAPTVSGTYYVIITNTKTGYAKTTKKSNEVSVTINERPSYKVTYYDGAVKLGEETVLEGAKPTHAGDYDELPMATFQGWFNNADLDPEHAVASIGDEVITAAISYYSKWNKTYAQDVDLVQLVLDNLDEEAYKTYDYATFLSGKGYLLTQGSGHQNVLDHSNAFDTGLKLKNSNNNKLQFNVQAGKIIKLTVGKIYGMSIAINGGAATAIASGTDATHLGVSYYYSANAQAVTIAETSTSYNMLKVIEFLDPMTVTYDATTNGGSCATEYATFTGTALTLPEATKSGWQFDGWFTTANDDSETGELVGVAGGTYTPSANITLYARFTETTTLATLTDIKVNGTTVDGFAIDKYEYNIVLPYKTSVVPIVAYTKGYSGATVTMTPSTITSVFGDVTLHVVSQDESKSNDYVLHITEAPKDMLCLIQATHKNATEATIAGYIGGTADKNTQGGSKLGSKGHYFGIQLASGTFQAGDVVLLRTADGADTNGDKVRIFKSNAASAENVLVEGTEAMIYGDNYVTLPETSLNQLYLRRGTDEENYNKDWNPYIAVFAVYRPYPNPLVGSMAINSIDMTINNAASPKTITGAMPSGTNFASLSVSSVAFLSNDPANTDGVLSGEWNALTSQYEGTYTVTDKDGDQTEYSVVLTEDVAVESVTISGETTVAAKSQITLTATVLPAGVENKNVTWTTSDASKATVDANGVVIGKAAGNVTITATSVADNTIFDTHEITVTPFVGTERVYWFTYAADAAANGVTNNSDVFGSAPTGDNSGSKEITLEEGWVVNTTKKAGGPSTTGTFVVPTGNIATLYVVAKGSGSSGRYVQLKQGDVIKYTSEEFGSEDPSVLKIDNVPAGTYTIAYVGGISNVYLYAAELHSYPITSVVIEEGFNLRLSNSRTPNVTITPVKAGIASQTWSIVSQTGAADAELNTTTGVITAGTQEGTMTVKVTVTDVMGNEVESGNCVVNIVNIIDQQPVTGSETWNWNELSMSSATITEGAPVLANYIEGDKWAMLKGTVGDKAYNTTANGSYEGKGTLSFTTTVPGLVTITARSWNNSPNLKIGDQAVITSLSGSTKVSKPFFVPAGEVVISASNANDGMRIMKIEFDADLTTDKIDGSFFEGYTREVNPQYYGTVCLPKAGVMVGAMLFQVAYMDYKDDAPYKVYYDEVENGTMQAGMPYIFLAEQSTIGVYYTGTAEETAKDHNGLHGTLSDITSGMNAEGIYMLYNNQVLHSTNSGSYLNANRAYLQISEIPGYGDPNYQAPAPTRRRIATGFNGENVATGLENLNASDKPMKLMINGQIFILRGEKMFDTTGRLVK